MMGGGKALLALATAMWAGALAAVGFMVAPKLFALLPDRKLAGEVAGHMFVDMAWLSLIGCIILLVYFLFAHPDVWRWLLLFIVALCTALNHFWVRSIIVALKTGGTMDKSFAFWHGISSLLYTLTLIGVVGLSFMLIRHE
jgi:CDP-diglyceride synthetase